MNRKSFVYKLECNVDDCTGEMLGYAMDILLLAGARDVHYIPVYMKKNRPGYLLCVICEENDVEKMERIIFKETTTLGIRRVKMESTRLPYEVITIKTENGNVKVKRCVVGKEIRFYPEYEDVILLCTKNQFSYRDNYNKIVETCRKQEEMKDE